MKLQAMEPELQESESNLKAELRLIDEQIKDAEANILKGEMLKELKEDERFKILFLDGYTEEEPKRLLEALINPSIHKRETIENMESMLSAIRNYKMYINFIEQDAILAAGSIDEMNEYRAKVTSKNSED